MNNSFFALIFRQKHIKRWGLMRNTQTESLSEHSMETAILAHALATIGNTYFGKCYDVNRAAVEALFHDASEVYTGDLPTPVKYYNEEIRNNYKMIEDRAISALISKMPEEMRNAYMKLLRTDDSDLHRIVKIADKLSAYIKCVEEEKSGNMEFHNAKESCYRALLNYNSEELNYFLEHFMPCFAMTLDDL